MKKFNKIFIGLVAISLITSCAKDTSTSTGWEYNNYKNGGFEKDGNFPVKEQQTGPGLVFIEGGTFTMGQTEQDVMQEWNNRAHRFTVNSFYMDRTEVTNFHWLEYMYWMKRVYYKSYPHVYKKCLPDTLSWRRTLGYREKLVNYYLRHPSYRDYPVVGVSWLQATDFCKWRTDRVNEAILVREGILKWHHASDFHDNSDVGAYNLSDGTDALYDNNENFNSAPENMFSTENYLNGNYNIEYSADDGELVKGKNGYGSYKSGYTMRSRAEGSAEEPAKDAVTKRKVPRDPYQLQNFDPVYAERDEKYIELTGRLGSRPVRMEDGILLPAYRLPTEAEWEFAATGLIGNLDPLSKNAENITDRRIYPWTGHYVRDDKAQFAGSIQANFSRGKGDFMGIAGHLNDGADITCRVDDFLPNDYGLYHMAGNVSEWVMDVYRPLSNEVMEEFMPFRGNVYTTQMTVPDGLYEKNVKASENLYDVNGMKEFVNEYARILYLTETKQNLGDFTQPYSDNIDEVTDFIKVYSRTTKTQTSGNGKKFDFLIGDSIYVFIDWPKVDSYLALHQNSTFEFDITDLTSNGAISRPEFFFIDESDPKNNKKITVDNNKEVYFNPKGVPQRFDSTGVAQPPANAKPYKMSGDWYYEFIMPNPGDYEIKFKFKDKTYKKSFTIYNNLSDKDPVNWAPGKSKILSRQNSAKYKYNSPSSNYVANNKQFSELDKTKFTVLDDINAILDTAIYLSNKGNLSKASHYLEVVLFGSTPHNKDIFTDIDLNNYRTSNKRPPNAAKEITGAIEFYNTEPITDPNNISTDNNAIFDRTKEFASNTGYASLSPEGGPDHYLASKFPNYNLDPNITSWIINLRNGLTEYTAETRGQQRWRNVTEEENAGRLNYRKDDYRDYLDGDLESSIYYNDTKKLSDINDGKRDPSQVMYQSDYENKNLQNENIAFGQTGWPQTLISNKSRVYKGGSWADKTYWMSSGNRRFLDEDKSSDQIGFRCAMDRLGSVRKNKSKR